MFAVHTVGRAGVWLLFGGGRVQCSGSERLSRQRPSQLKHEPWGYGCFQQGSRYDVTDRANSQIKLPVPDSLYQRRRGTDTTCALSVKFITSRAWDYPPLNPRGAKCLNLYLITSNICAKREFITFISRGVYYMCHIHFIVNSG